MGIVDYTSKDPGILMCRKKPATLRTHAKLGFPSFICDDCWSKVDQSNYQIDPPEGSGAIGSEPS